MALDQENFAKLPTFAQDAYKKIFGQASAIADRPIDASALAPGLDPYQSQAAGLLTQGLGSYVPYLEQAAQYAGPQGADAFMNPYTQNVVDTTTQQLQKQFGLQQAQANQRAVQSGAFAGSGSRNAIFDAALQGEQFDVLGKTVADLYSQGYGQAQQAGQNAAGIMGTIGQQMQGQRHADVNALYNLGEQRRGIGAQRAMYGYQIPMNQATFLQQAYTGMPTWQAPLQPNPMQMGIAGAGAMGGWR